jgi:hypothetical protein
MERIERFVSERARESSGFGPRIMHFSSARAATSRWQENLGVVGPGSVRRKLHEPSWEWARDERDGRAGAEDHPILQDVAVDELVGKGSLYIVSPLEPKHDTL